jgi:hypothetical protein
VVVIFQGNEAERLQNAIGQSPPWMQHLSHATHGPGLHLESNFDETAFFQRPGQAQHSAGDRNGLKFRGGTLAIPQLNQGWKGVPKLDSDGAPLRIGLGEVCHSQFDYRTAVVLAEDYRSTLSGFQ